MATICMVTPVADVYAMSTTSKQSDKDKDTTFSTLGVLEDSTTLSIDFNANWWFSKASVKTKGLSYCTFNKKSTPYSFEFEKQQLKLQMDGIGTDISVGSDAGIAFSFNDGVAMIETDDRYLSYSYTMYARCWDGNYRQDCTARYRITEEGKSKATVILQTNIRW